MVVGILAARRDLAGAVEGLLVAFAADVAVGAVTVEVLAVMAAEPPFTDLLFRWFLRPLFFMILGLGARESQFCIKVAVSFNTTPFSRQKSINSSAELWKPPTGEQPKKTNRSNYKFYTSN